MRLMHWYSEINKYATKNVPIVIIGTKLDLQSERKVDFETMENYAKSVGAKVMETSAKQNLNVNEAFELASKVVLNQGDSSVKTNEVVNLDSDDNGENKKKKGCCN